ncbi:MAG: hypothetical protein KAQ68_06180 [Clostridiales bacterium]|nr:hypothetical protein [Clostridiales bacterium]
MNGYYGGLLAIGLFGGFLVFLLGAAAYVLTAIGLYKMAQNQNLENPWLAWIPIAQFYVVGALIKEIKLGSTTIPRMELVLPLGALAVAVLSWIPFIGTLVALAYYALMVYSLYLLFKLYVPNEAVLYTILSALGLFAIFIFIIRDKDQVVVEAPQE